MGSVPVVAEDEDEDAGAVGAAVVVVVVVGVVGGELRSVEVVDAVVDGVVVWDVVGCVAPGTGDADGVEVCAA